MTFAEKRKMPMRTSSARNASGSTSVKAVVQPPTPPSCVVRRSPLAHASAGACAVAEAYTKATAMAVAMLAIRRL